MHQVDKSFAAQTSTKLLRLHVKCENVKSTFKSTSPYPNLNPNYRKLEHEASYTYSKTEPLNEGSRNNTP